jgi:uncharacterized Zn finger protein
MMAWYQWRPYVPVAARRRQASREMEALRRKGVDVQPIAIEGRQIAQTFWGKAWCDHLESFSDFANRLPRGRTYVRNGSVCHLAVSRGQILAKVSGSEMYDVKVDIRQLPAKTWEAVKRRCLGRIGSLLELLEGKLSDHVMTVVTDRQEGLFPGPGQMAFDCSCPDWASMCKHVAAVLYGVGARLDQDPALLFRLRGVKHEELVDVKAAIPLGKATGSGRSKRLSADKLGDVFGIELQAESTETGGDGVPKTPGKSVRGSRALTLGGGKKALAPAVSGETKKAVRRDARTMRKAGPAAGTLDPVAAKTAKRRGKGVAAGKNAPRVTGKKR